MTGKNCEHTDTFLLQQSVFQIWQHLFENKDFYKDLTTSVFLKPLNKNFNDIFTVHLLAKLHETITHSEAKIKY